MQAVMATAVDCTKVCRVIGAALPLLNQMVRRIGARLAADMANALVAGDHPRCQLAPCLCAVGTIQLVTAHTFSRLPTGRAVDRRLPWHGINCVEQQG